MVRQKASACGLKPRSSFPAERPSYSSPHGINVALLTHKSNTQPVISLSYLIVQKKRSFSKIVDEHIDAAVVIKISDCQATCWPALPKSRSGVGTHVLQSLAVSMEKEHRFFVSHVGDVDLGHIIRVTGRQDQIHVPVVVVIEKL